MNFYVKKYKEHSHQTIDNIRAAQKKYAKEILQPYKEDGSLNAEYIRTWGTKGLTSAPLEAIRKLGKEDLRAVKILDEARKKDYENKI